jgi:hypothetical protein
MSEFLICTLCIYARSLSSLLESHSKSSRRALRTDGDFDCPLLDCLDFTSFENKEGVGSLYNLHRERVRSVDKLMGKWDGTGQGQVKGRGKDKDSLDRRFRFSRS